MFGCSYLTRFSRVLAGVVCRETGKPGQRAQQEPREREMEKGKHF